MLKELGSDKEMAKEVSEAAATDDATMMADMADQAPIVRFVNLVLFQAVQDRASDIHFEPFETEFQASATAWTAPSTRCRPRPSNWLCPWFRASRSWPT